MSSKAHCPRCAGYEDAVMRRKAGDELAAHIKPCEAYAMSDRFRDWAVEKMRKEVGGSISAAGLDRMAILKGKDSASAAKPAASKAQHVAPDDEKAE